MSLTVESIILGIIQGLTEFLPVSSTAHLVIIPELFHWNSPLLNSLTFDVALHTGTLLAVVAYFFRDTIDLISGFFRGLAKRNFNTDDKTKLALLVFLGTIPAGVLGVLLDKWVETKFRTPAVLATSMIVIGLLMWYAERIATKMKRTDNLTIKDALIIGFSQALALVPGTSRSGITISSGLMLGYEREDAARFSFLLSIPVIAGAAVLKLKNFIHGIPHNEIAPLFFGTLFSAIFGFLSIKYFMKYVQRHSLNVFVWYRFLFAAIIIIFIYVI
ncbi:MAG: undecaprenyl-diphosphate phosphatase [Bacteroidetes bacterium]|nr:undecaprenyl-diphosphate phosphatase [Bacteroidota bacterium]MCL5737113.1 undecaprenyl-diphosphate phosphatase [Bacteroidota bacterium]